MFHRFQRAKEISVDIIPIIKCILAAKDFSGFQRAVRLELESFHGWDQVTSLLLLLLMMMTIMIMMMITVELLFN